MHFISFLLMESWQPSTDSQLLGVRSRHRYIEPPVTYSLLILLGGKARNQVQTRSRQVFSLSYTHVEPTRL